MIVLRCKWKKKTCNTSRVLGLYQSDLLIMVLVLLPLWRLNCVPTQKYRLKFVCFLLLMLLGGLQIPCLPAYPPSHPPSLLNLGWPTNPVSQVLFACCVNSYTTASVPSWPSLKLYSFSNVFTYAVYEVRVVESRLLYCGRRKPSNSLLPLPLGIFDVLCNRVAGRLPTHGKKTIKLCFITGIFFFLWLHVRTFYLHIFATGIQVVGPCPRFSAHIVQQGNPI